MAYCVMNNAKFSGPDMARGGLQKEWWRHPEDEMELKNSFSSNIDWSKTGLNYTLNAAGKKQRVPRDYLINGKPASIADTVLRYYDALQKQNEKNGLKARKLRKDATHVVSTVYTASPEFMAKHVRKDGTLDEVGEQYFRDCLAFDLKQGGSLISAVVHLDETTPHMHVIKAPALLRDYEKKQKDGTTVKTKKWIWSAKDLLGGAKRLSATQTKFAKEVGRAYGLERGEITVSQDESSYKAGEIKRNKHKNPEQYRAELNNELEELEKKAKAAQAELEKAKRQQAQMQQQIDRFNEQKRLADNEEKRKNNAKEERRKIQANTQALHDQAKDLRAEVARLKDERKTLEPAVAPLRAEKAQLLREVAPLRKEKEHAQEDAQRTREQAQRDAGAIRAEADEYARNSRTQADELLTDARQKAQSVGSVWDFLHSCVQALRVAVSNDEWRQQGATGQFRKSAFLTGVLEQFERWFESSNTRARYEDALEQRVGDAFKPAQQGEVERVSRVSTSADYPESPTRYYGPSL